MTGATDEEQLNFAIQEDRTLYTFNAADFARIHAEYLSQQKSHSGIIVIPQQRYSIGEKIRLLAALASSTTAEAMIDRIEYL